MLSMLSSQHDTKVFLTLCPQQYASVLPVGGLGRCGAYENRTRTPRQTVQYPNHQTNAPINRADNENRTHILGMASQCTNRCAISAQFEQDKRIELSYSDWKSDILTIILILQDEICPSSQTSILFTKALDFSRYCCGSGRIRTYSARRQQIYSLSHLSNCGALPSTMG